MSNDLNQSPGSFGGPLVVGLDAGGTRTRAVLAAAGDGRLVGEGASGPGNALTVPMPQLTEHLAEAVAAAVPEAARGRVRSVAGGFAGATAASPDDPGHLHARAALTEALRRLGIPAGPVDIRSDIEAAFASAPGTPPDGLALVAGTGAVAVRITGRRTTTTVDGDGWLLGDDGSGFWIGRSAVRAALRMADGRGPATALAGAVGRAFGLPQSVLPEDDLPDGAPPEGAAPDGVPARDEPRVGRGYDGGALNWPRSRREAYRMRLL
ncbi:BadF/BadG/BcrA/BcrD ATPase family protein, partial [Streptomyces resistomycificus]